MNKQLQQSIELFTTNEKDYKKYIEYETVVNWSDESDCISGSIIIIKLIILIFVFLIPH